MPNVYGPGGEVLFVPSRGEAYRGVSGMPGQEGISGAQVAGIAAAELIKWGYNKITSTASKGIAERDPYGPPLNGEGRERGRRRRRRRRLLTCTDKADIAFLHGQLGGGQLGRAAISSLLSRRCG